MPELSEGDGGSSEDIDAEDIATEDSGTEDSNVIDVKAVVISNSLIKCRGKDDYCAKLYKINDYVQRVFKQHPDAIIEVSYSLPPEEEKKA